MPYFTKVTADDGTESFVEVDFAEMEIPKEVIIGSKEYKAVQESDFKRRKRIEKLTAEQAELQKKLTSAGAEVVETEEDAPDEVVEQPVTPAPLNKDELYSEFKARMDAERKAEIEAEKARNAELEAAAKAAGLPKSAAGLLKYATDPVAMAKELAVSQYRFDDVDAGNVVPENEEVFLDKVFKTIGI